MVGIWTGTPDGYGWIWLAGLAAGFLGLLCWVVNLRNSRSEKKPRARRLKAQTKNELVALAKAGNADATRLLIDQLNLEKAARPKPSRDYGPAIPPNASSQYRACPTCGAATSRLNIFRCSCGRIYCDKCSGGGLDSLPVCPVSPYHEQRTRVGLVSGSDQAAFGAQHPLEVPLTIERGNVADWWRRTQTAWGQGDLRLAARCLLEILLLDPDLNQRAWNNLLMARRADLSGIPERLMTEVRAVVKSMGPFIRQEAADSPQARERRLRLVGEIMSYVKPHTESFGSEAGCKKCGRPLTGENRRQCPWCGARP
jgi:hypothetical protein